VGGTGGGGGGGGVVNVNLRGGTSVQTQGQGAHGLLAQSVGGGGGTGGDSSALAATVSYGRDATVADSNTVDLRVALSLGGGGGVSSSGNAVTLNIGDATPTQPTSIATYGDYANGVLAQSIGGGGGSGGYGATSTSAFGATRSINFTLGLGGTGSAGGDGGQMLINLNSDAVVATYGEGSAGLVVQSIGGGGGASQCGSVNLGTSYTLSLPGGGSGGNRTASRSAVRCPRRSSGRVGCR
jgi:hypothetical protein